jgi:hypothetical protein
VLSDALSRPFSKPALEQALKQPTSVQKVRTPEPIPEPHCAQNPPRQARGREPGSGHGGDACWQVPDGPTDR